MAKMSACTVVVCVLVALQAAGTLAGPNRTKFNLGFKKQEPINCKNFDFSITKLEVCPESMVTFKDFNITLNDNCEIITEGCVSSKAFDTAEITYEFNTTARIAQHGHENTKGKADACKELENVPEDAQALMKAMQLTTSCPMPEANQCAGPETTVDLKKYKKFIPLMWLATGKVSGDINIKYNNGVSCVKFEAELINLKGRLKKNPAEVMAGQAVVKTLALKAWTNMLKNKKN